MEQTFELPVLLRGQELLLPGRLVAYAYTYKIYIATAQGELTLENVPDNKRAPNLGRHQLTVFKCLHRHRSTVLVSGISPIKKTVFHMDLCS